MRFDVKQSVLSLMSMQALAKVIAKRPADDQAQVPNPQPLGGVQWTI
jgi:hypothetical protein